jgi:hypothetical protein
MSRKFPNTAEPGQSSTDQKFRPGFRGVHTLRRISGTHMLRWVCCRTGQTTRTSYRRRCCRTCKFRSLAEARRGQKPLDRGQPQALTDALSVMDACRSVTCPGKRLALLDLPTLSGERTGGCWSWRPLLGCVPRSSRSNGDPWRGGQDG